MSDSHSISRAGASHPSSPEPDNKVGLADEIVEGTLDMQINKATSGIACRTLAPIYSLPVELLSRILLHAIAADAHRCDVHHHRKQELASVSRRWRDTIFNDPAFWTTISLTPQWTPSLVQAHVQRSACLLVDIEIRLWATPDELDDLPLLLSVAMRCSDRWRSLIFDQNLVILDSFLEDTRDAMFPSLAYIVDDQVNYYGLQPENTPALVYLRTMHFFPPLPSTLRLMSEAFGFHPSPDDFRTLPSLEKLTTLDLRGIGKWVSDPTSIHFPHLTSLTLAVDEPADPLKYIVAPRLRHFCFRYSSALHTLDPVWATFTRLKNKFTTVTDLDIRVSPQVDNMPLRLVGHIIAGAFPEVRHLVLPLDNLPAFFGLHDYSANQIPANGWSQFERLTLRRMGPGTDTSPLVSWLQMRHRRGKTMLHVQLPPECAKDLLAIHWLRECCVLEEEEECNVARLGPNPEMVPQLIRQYDRISRERKLSGENCGRCRTDDIAQEEHEACLSALMANEMIDIDVWSVFPVA